MSLTDSSPLEVAKAASISSRNLAILPTQARNDALTAIHGALQGAKDTILTANAKDLELAAKAAEDGELSQSVLKRLDLGRKGKWEDMLQGILDVRDLEDPGEGFLRRSAKQRLMDRTRDLTEALHHSTRRRRSPDSVAHAFCEICT